MADWRVVLVILTAACVVPAQVASAQDTSMYWDRMGVTADSAANTACSSLFTTGEILQAGAPGAEMDRQLAVNYAGAAEIINRLVGDAEVIRPPAALELHHAQLLKNMKGLQSALSTTASRAYWATCEAERKSQLGCNQAQRSLGFSRQLTRQLGQIMSGLLDYIESRNRLERELLAAGVLTNSMTGCVTEQMK